MSQSLSLAAYEAINALETSEVFVALVELIIGNTTLRVCNNNEPVTHNGNTYEPFAFTIDFPDDIEAVLPTAVLEIDNVDQSIITALIASRDTLPTVNATLVLASSPDTVELPTASFALRDVTYDKEIITGTLTMDVSGDEPFPGDTFNPQTFDKLFTKPTNVAAV